jgi:hypothetical protein
VAESKFEPLDEDAWQHRFYSIPVDFGGGIYDCCDFADDPNHKH